MGILDIFKRSPNSGSINNIMPPDGFAAWDIQRAAAEANLKSISTIMPGGIKSVETRPFDECKQVSAYVVFDKATNAAILYIDMELGWIEGLHPTNLGLQTLFDEEGLKQNSQMNTPQLVYAGTILTINRYTSMRFLLICQDKKATHITIPWPPNLFDQLTQKRPFLFVGLRDGKAHFNGNLSESDRANLFRRYVDEVFK